jgi:alpha-tubulin suppressor-like RCC1 family protein
MKEPHVRTTTSLLVIALLGCSPARPPVDDAPADGVGAIDRALFASNQWWAGTVLDPPPLGFGRPLTLTYGFVPDGTWLYEARRCDVNLVGGRCPCRVALIDGRCPEDPAVHGTNVTVAYAAGPSDLHARMRDFLCTAHGRDDDDGPPPDPPSCCAAPDSAAACAPLWKARVRAGITSWAALSGLRVLEVPGDDGNEGCVGGVCVDENQGRPMGFRFADPDDRHNHTGAEPWPGACRPETTCSVSEPANVLRADVRIGGRAFAENGSGFTMLPGRGGDIAIDTTNVWTLPAAAVPTKTVRCRTTPEDPLDTEFPYHPQCAMGQWLLHDGRFNTGNPMAWRNTPLERLRQLTTHELGHSLGILHPCPASGDIQAAEAPDCPGCIPYVPANGPSQLAQQRVMEPTLGRGVDVNPRNENPEDLRFIPRAPQGPRADDVRAAQFQVGDVLEPNNVVSRATLLGRLEPGTTRRVGYHVGAGSIAPGPGTGPSWASPTWALNHHTILDRYSDYPRTSIAAVGANLFSDTDWYSIDLGSVAGMPVTFSLAPVGGVYADNDPDGSCPDPGVTTDTRRTGNLSARLYRSDGAEVVPCTVGAATGRGGLEAITITVPPAELIGDGIFRLRVTVNSNADGIPNCVSGALPGDFYWDGPNRRIQPYVLEVTQGAGPVLDRGDTGVPAGEEHRLHYVCRGAGLCSSAELALGTAHTCARLDDGTVRCWGANERGQLGDGTTSGRVTPAVPDLAGLAQIATGVGHTCARFTDGTVRCWGANDRGQVGDGSRTDRVLPAAAVGRVDVVEIAAGGDHTCARVQDGRVWCWGANGRGQLGDDTTHDRLIPRRVPDLERVTHIAAGYAHTCAVLADETVRCWGRNDAGQVGDATNCERHVPTVVPALGRVIQLALGRSHSCALLDGGTVVCWGRNDRGQLGDGTTTDHRLPEPVPGLSGVAEVTAGTDHTCARLLDGTARCWGANGGGQIGDGSTTDRLEPTVVPALSGVTQIAAGHRHTCARVAGGPPRCWGGNTSGQIGDGTLADRAHSVSVVW